MTIGPRQVLALTTFALAGCTHYPSVVNAAFDHAPRRIAVVDYDSDLIRGMLPPRPSPEIEPPYRYFRQKLATSPLFQLIDDREVLSNPVYVALPTHSRNVEVTAGGLRAVTLDNGSAAKLAGALHADLVITVHFSPEVEPDSPLGKKIVSSTAVEVEAEIEAWDARGERAWRDEFTVESGEFGTILGFHSTDDATQGAAAAIGHASQVALDRLNAKLAGADVE